MKRVWQCDFCTKSSINKDIIGEHEKNCSSNPLNRHCYTCIHAYADEYSYSSVGGCNKNLEYWNYEEVGNCHGWETDNIKLLRKLKIKKLIK